MAKINVEMTEEEYKQFLLVKRCIRGKRETQTILDLANRLEKLSEAVYKALCVSDECANAEIINDSYARAALALATKELY